MFFWAGAPPTTPLFLRRRSVFQKVCFSRGTQHFQAIRLFSKESNYHPSMAGTCSVLIGSSSKITEFSIVRFEGNGLYWIYILPPQNKQGPVLWYKNCSPHTKRESRHLWFLPVASQDLFIIVIVTSFSSHYLSLLFLWFIILIRLV